MSIEQIAVWPIPPDWKDGMTETLEWLTSVAASPLSVEQRRGLRLSPRQSYEYSFVIHGTVRTYFDLLMMRASGSPMYVPLWYEIERLTAAGNVGDTILNLGPTEFTEFTTARYAILHDHGSIIQYEVVEIVAAAETSIEIAAPLVNDWPAKARIYPLKKCRIDVQPTTSRRADKALVSRVRFTSLEPNKTTAANPLSVFNDIYVLEEDPNEAEDLTYVYGRVMYELDNRTGVQALSDVTGFVLQKFSWFAHKRCAQSRLRGLFYALDGRRTPIWVPTVYADFELAETIEEGAVSFDVLRCGFTDLGGPSPARQWVVFQMRSGVRFYRKIVESAIVGDGCLERLVVNLPFENRITASMILRISFLVLCRLDQDSIEFVHYADTKGLTTVNAVFRSLADYDLSEIEVPPNPPFTVVCAPEFQWFGSTPDLADLEWTFNPSNTPLDRFGNFLFLTGTTKTLEVYSPSGVLKTTLSPEDVADDIDAWAGSAVVNRSVDLAASSFYAATVFEGRYVLVYINTASGGTFERWWSLYESSADGSLSFISTIRYRAFLGPPYTSGLRVWGALNEDDAILYDGYAFLGSSTNVIGVLPSIREFKENTYANGWEALPDFRVPAVMLYPVGTEDLSSGLGFITGTTNGSNSIGFLLPGATGNVNLYIYANRSYMDYAAAHTLFVSPELKNVIQPDYPNGCMIKINLGSLDFVDIANDTLDNPALASYAGRATDMYSIDNDNWVDSDGLSVIPFSDEYTYVSSGEVGGADCYSMQIGTVVKRPNGKYWIVFYMLGHDDWLARNGNHVGGNVYETVRVFEYDPTTEVAEQIVKSTCVLHNDLEVPNSTWTIDDDYYQAISLKQAGDIVTLFVQGLIYKTSFCKFNVPDE